MNDKMLGRIVKDRVTGFIGVVENRAEYLHGCARYYVQPQIGEDGKIPDGRLIDEQQLEILADRDPVMSAPVEPMILFHMGDEAKDPVTDVKGIVTGRAVYLNGCSRVLITPKQKTKVVQFWVYEGQLLAGKRNKIAAPTRVEKITGGPAPSCSKY